MAKSALVGKKVVVRDNRAGVHVGELTELDRENGNATLISARKIWFWKGAASCHGIAGAASCHGIAVRGIAHEGSKVCPVVTALELFDVIEIAECTPEGYESTFSAPEWKP